MKSSEHEGAETKKELGKKMAWEDKHADCIMKKREKTEGCISILEERIEYIREFKDREDLIYFNGFVDALGVVGVFYSLPEIESWKSKANRAFNEK